MKVQTLPRPFDDEKAQGFAERLVGALNEAALALMTSLGHRTGLFDTLADSSAATSDLSLRSVGIFWGSLAAVSLASG